MSIHSQTSLSLSSTRAISQLLAMAQQAREEVPFYQESLAHVNFTLPVLQLTDLPLLSKETARSAQEKLVKPGYTKGRPGVRIEYTSGSTGMPLLLVRTREEAMRGARVVWRARAEIFPDVMNALGLMIVSEEDATPTLSELGMRQKERKVISVSTRDLRPDSVDTYLDLLDYLRPAWLGGPPAILAIVAEGLRRTNRRLRSQLAFVESSSDALSLETRRLLAEVFNCRIANHYGSREVYTIAYECPKGSMHLCEDSIVAEFLPGQSPDEYELVVSSLIFEVMPFIRYELGDVIQLPGNNCICGNSAPLLGLVRGRVGEVIAGTALLGHYVFSEVVEQIFLSLGTSSILEYEVYQTALDSFEVQFVLQNKELFREVCSRFRENVACWLPKARFSFESVDHLELLSHGKRKSFILCV
jgi:phenylacetate-coenzyme A ligase PaaK-like adenylate-forming protein